jgi:hypothetical protein
LVAGSEYQNNVPKRQVNDIIAFKLPIGVPFRVKHFRFVLAAMLVLPLAGSAQDTISGQKTVSAQNTISAQTTPDPAKVLQATGEKLLADLKRMPRYTCVQTITRTYYEGKHHFEHPSCSSLITAHDTRKKKLPVEGWDRLRLEVALVDGNSVYSWVGAPRFSDDTLDKLAGQGRWVAEILAYSSMEFCTVQHWFFRESAL